MIPFTVDPNTGLKCIRNGVFSCSLRHSIGTWVGPGTFRMPSTRRRTCCTKLLNLPLQVVIVVWLSSAQNMTYHRVSQERTPIPRSNRSTSGMRLHKGAVSQETKTRNVRRT